MLFNQCWILTSVLLRSFRAFMPWNRLLRFGKGGLRGVKPWTKMCHLQSLLNFTKSGKVTRFSNLLFAYIEQKLVEKLAAKLSERWVFMKCVPQSVTPTRFGMRHPSGSPFQDAGGTFPASCFIQLLVDQVSSKRINTRGLSHPWYSR